jgi:hypothetical protein
MMSDGGRLQTTCLALVPGSLKHPMTKFGPFPTLEKRRIFLRWSLALNHFHLFLSACMSLGNKSQLLRRIEISPLYASRQRLLGRFLNVGGRSVGAFD